jgi:hypothetical protein
LAGSKREAKAGPYALANVLCDGYSGDGMEGQGCPRCPGFAREVALCLIEICSGDGLYDSLFTPASCRSGKAIPKKNYRSDHGISSGAVPGLAKDNYRRCGRHQLSRDDLSVMVHGKATDSVNSCLLVSLQRLVDFSDLYVELKIPLSAWDIEHLWLWLSTDRTVATSWVEVCAKGRKGERNVHTRAVAVRLVEALSLPEYRSEVARQAAAATESPAYA